MITAPILELDEQVTKNVNRMATSFLMPILQENQLPCIDLTQSAIGGDYHNFYDYHHLNNLGKTKYNSILAEELLKEFTK